MIIRSDWRGEPRNTSAPKRAISKREADIDIISMAQQARPNDIGQMEFLRAQLIALPSVVVNMSPDSRLSSKPASSMRANRSAGPLASGFSSILFIFSRTEAEETAPMRNASNSLGSVQRHSGTVLVQPANGAVHIGDVAP